MDFEYKVTTDYTVKNNTDKEVTLLEENAYTLPKMPRDYARKLIREYIIKKDKLVITTCLNALKDKELLEVYTILNDVMKERGIKLQNQYKKELNYGQGYKAYATEKGVVIIK